METPRRASSGSGPTRAFAVRAELAGDRERRRFEPLQVSGLHRDALAELDGRALPAGGPPRGRVVGAPGAEQARGAHGGRALFAAGGHEYDEVQRVLRVHRLEPPPRAVVARHEQARQVAHGGEGGLEAPKVAHFGAAEPEAEVAQVRAAAAEAPAAASADDAGEEDDRDSGSLSVITSLEEGDQVWVEWRGYGDSFLYSNPYKLISFSGYLITSQI